METITIQSHVASPEGFIRPTNPFKAVPIKDFDATETKTVYSGMGGFYVFHSWNKETGELVFAKI